MDELTETLAMLDSKDVGRDADARKLKKQQDLWVQL